MKKSKEKWEDIISSYHCRYCGGLSASRIDHNAKECKSDNDDLIKFIKQLRQEAYEEGQKSVQIGLLESNGNFVQQRENQAYIKGKIDILNKIEQQIFHVLEIDLQKLRSELEEKREDR